MGESLVVAIGLLLLVEGVVPFLFPRQWRDTIERIAKFSDGQLRFFGLMALLSGLGVLSLAKLFF